MTSPSARTLEKESKRYLAQSMVKQRDTIDMLQRRIQEIGEEKSKVYRQMTTLDDTHSKQIAQERIAAADHVHTLNEARRKSEAVLGAQIIEAQEVARKAVEAGDKAVRMGEKLSAANKDQRRSLLLLERDRDFLASKCFTLIRNLQLIAKSDQILKSLEVNLRSVGLLKTSVYQSDQKQGEIELTIEVPAEDLFVGLVELIRNELTA